MKKHIQRKINIPDVTWQLEWCIYPISKLMVELEPDRILGYIQL